MEKFDDEDATLICSIKSLDKGAIQAEVMNVEEEFYLLDLPIKRDTCPHCAQCMGGYKIDHDAISDRFNGLIQDYQRENRHDMLTYRMETGQ